MAEGERAASVRWVTAAGWASLVVFAATSTLVATSLKEIGSEFELSLALRGALAPARSLVLALFAFAVGYVGDRVGKRRLLGAAMFVIAFALLRMAQSGTYAGLVGGILVLGAGLGGLEALVSPLVADLHPDDVEVQMPVLHAFFPLGIVVSAPIAGWALDSGVPWRVPFAVVSIPAALVGVMFLFGRYPGDGGSARPIVLSVPDVLRNPTFWLLAVVMALTAGTEGSLLFWTPSFIQDGYGATFLGGAFGLVGFSAAMAVGRFSSGFAARVVPLSRLMIVLSFVCALATLSLVAINSLWVSFVSLGVGGLCVACFWPGVLSTATRRIAAGSATLLAMLSVAGIAGFGIVPWAVGLVGDRFGLRVGLGLLPVSMAVAGFALTAVFRPPTPGSAADEPLRGPTAPC
jgi:fucose permease